MLKKGNNAAKKKKKKKKLACNKTGDGQHPHYETYIIIIEIVFEDVIAVRDSVSLEHLKELSSRRRVIEHSINQTSFIIEAIAREMSGGSTSRSEQECLRLEHYLPLLENFIYHADIVNNSSQMIRWTSQLKIQWTSFFQIDTLFLYGAVLRERALEFLPADLEQSAFIFREAAGVFHYLAHEVLPSLHSAISAEKPPEATSSVTSAISLICLAKAQAVYIRKAEEKGNTGFGVLEKLHHGVADLLSEAVGTLNSGIGDSKGISSRFLEFITSCKALHELRSQTYFAEGLKNDGQVGIAIGKIPVEDSWKTFFRKEIENSADTLRKFEHENEFVWHEKIPSGDELPLLQGHKIVKIEPYRPKKWERELAFKIWLNV
ncbi:hypothetical protein P3X46_023048 [Hevea brasiliensis]|uniref:BRO1 domain-containing protein n=1 Tax=Hevea brasiliensis TaxID=3981 RepID=A0ABQ9L9S4_HEVBR|nr:hypothetical protein P3X46_023048 [Hevea brasiliensis]